MRRDAAYLLDMLIAAREARGFAVGLTWEQFEESRLHQNAVIRSLETIGEAAARMSDEFRDAHPELPWFEMTGMRNRLIHGYFEVDLLEVWDTLQTDVPSLVAAIEALLGATGD